MKKWWLSLLCLLITLTAFSTVINAQELSPSNEITNEQIKQLENDLATKRKQLMDLMYGNFYQAETMNKDISFVSPTGNEEIVITERGIYPSNDDVPAAYWLIEVKNTSDHFQLRDSVLLYLSVQEEGEGYMRHAETMVQYANPALITQGPIEEIDFSIREAPGSIQSFIILVKLENPSSRYSLVTQLNDATLDVDIFTDLFGNNDIRFILENPDLSINDTSMAEQIEKLIAEFNTLEHELDEATIAYYNSSDYDASLFEFEPQNIVLPPLSQETSNEVTLIQHGVEEVMNGRTEAFWVFQTSNNSTNFQYATNGLWSLTGHQTLRSLSSYIMPYTITHVGQTNNGTFYPLNNDLSQAIVEPGWEGFFKVSMLLGSEIYEHYLIYGDEDNSDSVRLDVYGYDEILD